MFLLLLKFHVFIVKFKCELFDNVNLKKVEYPK